MTLQKKTTSIELHQAVDNIHNFLYKVKYRYIIYTDGPHKWAQAP